MHEFEIDDVVDVVMNGVRVVDVSDDWITLWFEGQGPSLGVNFTSSLRTSHESIHITKVLPPCRAGQVWRHLPIGTHWVVLTDLDGSSLYLKSMFNPMHPHILPRNFDFENSKLLFDPEEG